MQRGTVARIVSVLFIGAASAVLLLGADPEYATVVSADGNMTVRGFSRAGDFVITQEDGAQYGMSHNVYRVTPEETWHDLPLQLRLSYENSTGYGTPAMVRYDDTRSMWTRMETDDVDAVLVASTTQLGVFSSVMWPDVAAPDFVSVYDALRSTAPANAVGYRIVVGYRVADEAVVLQLDDAGQQGGCNGAVQPGEDTAYATSTRTAHVLVNDVQTPVTFTFFASWYVVDGASCPEGQPFRAADERAILPVSS